MDVCLHMWLFTLSPLLNAARVSEACRPADETRGFRFPYNLPLSVVHREEWTLENELVIALVQGLNLH